MKLKSQLTAPKVAVDRNVDNTVIDALSIVKANIDSINTLADESTLAEIAAVASLDFSAVLDAVSTVDNLSVSVVETLPAGSQASAVLNGSVIELRIPEGSKGLTGLTGATGATGERGPRGYTGAKGETGMSGARGKDGFTPNVEFRVDPATGELEYNITYDSGYTEIKEW